MNDKEKYENMKREAEVIGKTHDLLKLCTFPGHLAQDLVMSQIYLQGLYKAIQVEVDKLAPAVEPLTAAEMSPAAK